MTLTHRDMKRIMTADSDAEQYTLTCVEEMADDTFKVTI